MNRTDAMRLELRRLEDLQRAAAQYANSKGAEEREVLCRAAIAWHEAADTVLDAILRETAGRELTTEERTDVDRVVPRLRIVRDV